MNVSEAQNCAKVEMSRCDEQSAVEDKNAQSVTHYHSVDDSADAMYRPVQSVEVMELGQTEVRNSGEAVTEPADSVFFRAIVHHCGV